jgi:S1-C subfamily serine protease
MFALVGATAALPALDEEARIKARAELREVGSELQKLSRVFNLVHEVVAPSVVAIHTRSQEAVPYRTPFGGVFYGGSREVEVGEGSGFVFFADDKASYLVTNSHVVLRMNEQQQFERDRSGRYIGYDRITVELNDGREADAEYIGWSVETDLAVLKIPLPKLPAVEWADSDRVHVGDWVLALGYPLGVGYSATSGIVSATDRSTGIYKPVGGFESFIQTDAAINPGNSGGPLVDITGRIMGVNSNILSRTGNNIGLGFAIPSNLARRVAEDLLRHGEVKWPGIGVDAEELNPEQSAALGLPAGSAVRFAHVYPDTPAERGGLQSGDVLLAVGGIKVAGQMQFRSRLAACRIGQEVPLTLWRGGKQVESVVVPVALEDIKKKREKIRAEDEIDLKSFGLRLGADGQPGLVVTEINPNGLAAQAGLEPGDRIMAEKNLGTFKAADDAKPLLRRQEITIQVYKDGRSFWLRMRR